mmetsp:Transcript_153727/g.268884  ORF Transcript_153727/g.268884 Transcript_153727/m.268884 type:complete len:220 (+) Transcript_153727:93-752(+)
MPTESAISMNRSPMSRNLARSANALNLWLGDSSTCNTIGNWCGGGEFGPAKVNQSSKAPNCSVKKLLGLYSFCSPFCILSIWETQQSRAKSHTSHMGCFAVDGKSGYDWGLQLSCDMIRSANRKFRKREASRRSCRKRRWNNSLGSSIHAIVSVMAVKIQFSSPVGVLRSFICPSRSSVRLVGTSRKRVCLFCNWNHVRAILIGVVRQEVKISAGSCGV